MARLALALAALALLAALWPAPGPYVGLGCGIGALGVGRIAYARPSAPGATRLLGAAAMTAGILASLLALARIALTLAALSRIDAMIR